jgi:hypothetical protein
LPIFKLLVGSDRKYKEMEPLVFKFVDEYVASYSIMAEIARLPIDGVNRDKLWQEHRRTLYNQVQEMHNYRYRVPEFGEWQR